MWVAFVVLVLLVLPRVSLRAPAIHNVQHGLRLECRVARHPDNRLLKIGLVDIADSERPITGEQDRVIHELLIRSVPCEPVVEAYCLLVDKWGRTHVARQPIVVFPCGSVESL